MPSTTTIKYTKVSNNLNIEEILQVFCLTTLDGSKEVHAPIEDVKLAILRFGRQLLELAAENAKVICNCSEEPINWNALLNTIKQVE